MNQWRELLGLYLCTRQVGHTRAVVEAARACGGVVLCATEKYARELSLEWDVSAVGIAHPERLRGRPRPLLVDNQLMTELLHTVVALDVRADRADRAAEMARRDRDQAVEELGIWARRWAWIDGQRCDAMLNGAFFALAMIGHAVAGGMLCVEVTEAGGRGAIKALLGALP